MASFDLTFTPTWRDMDALGHVNNAVYSTYLENARRAFWEELVGEPCGIFPFLLARTEIDFRAPVSWNNQVTLSVHVSRIGNSSFELSYGFDTEDGTRAADAKTVLVMFDHEAGETVAIDDELKSRLTGYTS